MLSFTQQLCQLYSSITVELHRKMILHCRATTCILFYVSAPYPSANTTPPPPHPPPTPSHPHTHKFAHAMTHHEAAEKLGDLRSQVGGGTAGRVQRVPRGALGVPGRHRGVHTAHTAPCLNHAAQRTTQKRVTYVNGGLFRTFYELCTTQKNVRFQCCVLNWLRYTNFICL